MVKNLPASAGGLRDVGLIPGSEDPLEEGMATHSSVLAWRLPWTEEPGGLQSIGSCDWTGLKQLNMQAHIAIYSIPWLPAFPFYRHTDRFCFTLMYLQVFYAINNAAMTAND